MTLYEFNALSEHEKAEAIWQHGQFVADRLHDFYTVLLYQVLHYVDLYYDQAANEIGHLGSLVQQNSSTHICEQLCGHSTSKLIDIYQDHPDAGTSICFYTHCASLGHHY